MPKDLPFLQSGLVRTAVAHSSLQDLAEAFYNKTVIGGEWPTEDDSDQMHYEEAFMKGVMFVWIQDNYELHPDDAMWLVNQVYPIFHALL